MEFFEVRIDQIEPLNVYRFRPLWLRSSVVSVLLSVTAGTVPAGTSIVTLIFGNGGWVRGLLRSSHGLTRYCSTGEIGPLPHWERLNSKHLHLRSIQSSRARSCWLSKRLTYWSTEAPLTSKRPLIVPTCTWKSLNPRQPQSYLRKKLFTEICNVMFQLC